MYAAPRTLFGLLLGLALPAAAEAGFTDPFADCAAVGDVDAPDARFTGPAVPGAVSEGTVRLGLVAADAPQEFREHTAWRCMGGRVWICSFGANIPCNDRARTSKAPTKGMIAFCEENTGSSLVPAFATGRDTVYEWRCNGREPAIVRVVAKPDARGFLAEFWHELPAPSR